MASASHEVQAAIFAALSADAGVKAEIGDPARVYANPPPGAVMPFVTLSEVSAGDWSTVSWYGREILFDVHAWGEMNAAAGGRIKLLAVMDACEMALRTRPTGLTGHRLGLLRFLSSRVLLDPDGRTLHGVISLRALTNEED